MRSDFTIGSQSKVFIFLVLPFLGVGLGCVRESAQAQQPDPAVPRFYPSISSGPAQNAAQFPWQSGGLKVRISYSGGDEKPVDPLGRPALCDSFDLSYFKQTRVLYFETCEGARIVSRRNVLLTTEHAQQFESVVSRLQLLSTPRCPPVADAGILFVTIQNTSGILKSYVDSVTCGYGTFYSGVLEYETILDVLNVTKGLVGK